MYMYVSSFGYSWNMWQCILSTDNQIKKFVSFPVPVLYCIFVNIYKGFLRSKFYYWFMVSNFNFCKINIFIDTYNMYIKH